MTANQINFANLGETKRHNKVSEKETQRHNQSSEGIQYAGVREQARHNVATEGINWYSAQSLAGLQSLQGQKVQSEVGVQAAEQRAKADYYTGQLGETTRHNIAVENETAMHNRTTESTQATHWDNQDTIAAYDAATRRGGSVASGFRDLAGGVAGLYGVIGSALK